MTRRRLLPLCALLVYAIAFGASSLGVSLPAFDDHPGQLYRLVHVLARGPAPWAWEPGWWTGYPELQFYPPGFAYAGAALHALSLGRLGAGACYTVLVWIAYLAPGVTAYLGLRRLLGDGWAALPGAFVTLTLDAGVASGVEGGVHVGMVPARMAWALLPLLLWSLVPWLAGARRFPPLAVGLLAAIVLTHPAHAPAALVIVLLAAVAVPRGARRGVVAGLAIAAALTAFWTLPLLARVGETRALAWGRLDVLAALRQPLVPALLVAAAAAAWRPRSRAERVVAALPWATVAVVAGDALLLEPLGVRLLPADRVADGAWMAVLLAAGLAAGRGLLVLDAARAAAGAWWRRRPAIPAPAGALAAVALAVALSLPAGTLALWPRAAAWPSYATVARGLRLDDLWTALRAAPPGRVLFLRSSVPLVYGTAWWRPHTHVTALTPLGTGRGIVDGTFTHPSPVAALVYRGDAGRAAVRRLAERLDGREIFGRPLEQVDAAFLVPYLDRLGVSVVVALDEDVGRVPALDDTRAFHRRAVPPFVVYERRDVAERAGRVAPPVEVAPGRWRVTITGEPGAWAGARVASYPLWRAEVAGGRVPARRGEDGELEIRLPSADATVDLVYAAGAPEWAGVAVSALGVIALAAWGVTRAQTSGS